MGAQRVDEGRLEQRHHVLGGGGEAQGEVALGVPRLHQRAHDQLAVGLGDPRRPHPDRPRDLQQPVLGQAGVAERFHPLRRAEVGVGQAALVRVGVGDAQRRRRPLQEVEVDLGDLGDLPRRVARAVAGQGPLGRQQGEASRLDRLPQLRQRHAFGRESLEQLAPGLPRLPLDSLEQALRLEVDRLVAGHA